LPRRHRQRTPFLLFRPFSTVFNLTSPSNIGRVHNKQVASAYFPILSFLPSCQLSITCYKSGNTLYLVENWCIRGSGSNINGSAAWFYFGWGVDLRRLSFYWDIDEFMERLGLCQFIHLCIYFSIHSFIPLNLIFEPIPLNRYPESFL
jgi:hypothetical protein